MMKRLFYIFCLLVAINAHAQELRVAGEYGYKIDKKQSLNFSTEWRNIFEEKTENYLYFRADYAYKLSKQVRLKLSNRYAFECEDMDNSRLRTTLDLIYKPKKNLGDYDVNNRLRLQQQIVDWNRVHYTLRERLKFSYELNEYAEPYASVELLYTLNSDEAYAGNVSFGFEFELGELEFDLYYKSEIESGYKTVLFNHVIGTVWSF